MPLCPKLDSTETIEVVSSDDDLQSSPEQFFDATRPFPFLNDETNWVNSLFQTQPALPESHVPPPPASPPEYFPQAPLSEKHSVPCALAEAPSSPEETKFVPIELFIQNQPPVRVRTRTPNEIRTFSVSGCLTGHWFNLNAKFVKVSLAYAAPVPNGRVDPVTKDILGGTKLVQLKEDGTFRFSNLSISESSTKHNEKEFCLHFIVLGNDGVELIHQLSEPFYAYSHKKVLQRRETIKLRELSRTSTMKLGGGEVIHAVGFPFKQSSNFEVIFRSNYGETRACNYEFFSESVLYFQVPPCPVPGSQLLNININEIKVSVVVTNDGKLFSNALDFTYVIHPESKN